MVASFAIDTSNASSAAPPKNKKKKQPITLIEASAHYGSHIVIALK